MQGENKKLFKNIYRFIDLLIILFSFYVAYYLRLHPAGLKIHALPIQYPIFFLTYLTVWLYLSSHFILYASKRLSKLSYEAWDVCKTTALCLVIATLPAFFIREYPLGRLFLLYLWPLQTGSLILFRFIFRKFLKYIHLRGNNFRQVLIVGRNRRTEIIAKKIEEAPEYGLRLIGCIDCTENGNSSSFNNNFNLLGNLEDFEKILKEEVVDEVIVTLPMKSFYSEIEKIISICEQVGVEVKIPTDLFSHKLAKSKITDYYDIQVIDFYTSPKMNLQLVIKRLIDVIASSVLLVLLSPLFVIVSVLIKATSKGPLFYPWKVVGQNNRDFVGYKFRTMTENADTLKESLMAQNEMEGPVFKMTNDPRITPIGKWLRKFSVDELPQLWSVLKGDMSLVGPRPPNRNELVRYEFWQRRKISFKPGITCLWQVQGRNRINDFNEWCKLDLDYIDNWSLWLDFKILFKTTWVVVKGTGY
jgi:exopolysaccharide biosynthesis polyprenyl glycosylphosphotransferase